MDVGAGDDNFSDPGVELWDSDVGQVVAFELEEEAVCFLSISREYFRGGFCKSLRLGTAGGFAPPLLPVGGCPPPPPPPPPPSPPGVGACVGGVGGRAGAGGGMNTGGMLGSVTFPLAM